MELIMWSFVCCVENHNIIAKITSTVIEGEKLKGEKFYE
jgi:hypothetical protein